MNSITEFDILKEMIGNLSSIMITQFENTNLRIENIDLRLKNIESNTDQENWCKKKMIRLKRIACKINGCNGFIGINKESKILIGTALHCITSTKISSLKIEINQEIADFFSKNGINLKDINFECYEDIDHDFFAIKFALQLNENFLLIENEDRDFFLNTNYVSKIADKVAVYSSCNKGVEIMTGNIVGKDGDFYICDINVIPGFSGSIVSNCSSLIGIIIGIRTLGEEFVFNGTIHGITQLNQLYLDSLNHELLRKKNFVTILDFNELDHLTNTIENSKYFNEIQFSIMQN